MLPAFWNTLSPKTLAFSCRLLKQPLPLPEPSSLTRLTPSSSGLTWDPTSFWRPPLTSWVLPQNSSYLSHNTDHMRYLHVNVSVFLSTSLVAQRLKASASNVGDLGSIPGLGRSPGEGNGNPLQYSCLENPTDRGPGRPQSMGSQRVRHDWATSPPSSSLNQTFSEDQSNDRFARSPQHPAWGLVYYLLLTKCHQVSKKGHIISIGERIEEESMEQNLYF